MKVFAAGLGTETNTFSPIPTRLGDFDIIRNEDDLGPVIYNRNTILEHRRLARERGWDGLLSLSLFHGFPWGDVPSTSVVMLVIAGNDPAKAHAIVEATGSEFFALRHRVAHMPDDMGEVLDRVQAMPATGRSAVAADTGDNAVGGAPGHSTFVLSELLRRGMRDVGQAMIWDPIVVQLAISAGVGAALRVRLGGKMSAASGDPLDLTVKVMAIVPGMVRPGLLHGHARHPRAPGDPYPISAGRRASIRGWTIRSRVEQIVRLLAPGQARLGVVRARDYITSQALSGPL